MNAQTAPKSAEIAEFPPPASRGHLVPMLPETVARSYPPKLAKAIMAITREFGVISKATHKEDTKGGWNSFHNYGYQKWEDVLERESTLVAKHGIIIQQSEVARSLLDKVISLSYEFTIINEDGDCWPDRPVFTAIGRLQDHKGIFDDKAANKCHTQAHKYFLLHLFKIKTKESIEDDADAATDEVTSKQITAPKPPKPGSAEAKAMEGPRLLEPAGINANGWADVFAAAIENATPAETDQWTAANKEVLERIGNGNYPDADAKVQAAIAARRPQTTATAAKPPKPPRPDAKPAVAPMPDPATDAPGWLKWLTAKYADFKEFEPGEKFWNEVVQTLDLTQDQLEDAMGVWSRFEERFEG